MTEEEAMLLRQKSADADAELQRFKLAAMKVISGQCMVLLYAMLFFFNITDRGGGGGVQRGKL